MKAVIHQQTITASPETSTASLIEACGLPEIGALLTDRSLRVAEPAAGPFTATGSSITVSPQASADLWSAASTLREALELLTFDAATPRWAHRIIAHATASIYGETILVTQQRGPDSASLMFPGVYDRLLSGEDPDPIALEIAAFVSDRDRLGVCPAGEIRAAGRALPLSYPTEVLLTLGGDHRQMVDWKTGVNSYGLSPRPVPWRSQFGSCTASSPSPRAFEAARTLRQELIRAAFDDVLDDAADSIADSIRIGIRNAFNLEGNVDVVLTPSGTDAEFLALALAASASGPVHSLVLAPNEIGSGSLKAASGQHFSTHSPFSNDLMPGTLLDGFASLITGVSTVDVRDEVGHLRPPEDVELEMRTIIENLSGSVLVHVVEGTKTGVRLPRDQTLTEWETVFGDNLTIVVDAAQVRVDQSTVARHVDAGRMVIVTGSKFIGGPPFAGAVLVPPSLTESAEPIPLVSLSQYFSRHDVPSHLATLRSSMSPAPNHALLLRWAAAMAEVSSFTNASPEIRDEILRGLVVGVRRILDSATHTRIVESPYTMIPSDDHRGLDELPTIFTFLVLDKSGTPLGMEEARRVHLLLATDLSATQDETSAQVMRQAFHLGQPVAISRGIHGAAGALRVAIGAPTLSQIVFDVSRGENWRDRLELELAEIQTAVHKLALVVDSVEVVGSRSS